MARLALVLLLVAALGAVLYLFVFAADDEGLVGDVLDRTEDDVALPPELRGLPASEREAYLERQRLERERARAEAEEAARRANAPTVLAEGTVVDASTGAPIEGARVWVEPARDPCPRYAEPTGPFVDSDKPAFGAVLLEARTNAEGRFRIVTREVESRWPEALDVFAYARGYVLHVTCAAGVGAMHRLALDKGLSLRGRVTSRRGGPVAGAILSVRPAPETPDLPGHRTPTFDPFRTNDDGRFEVSGLKAGELLLDIDHPEFMPQTLGPHDPATTPPLEVVLVPALRTTFVLRTDDGRDPEHPTLVWRTVETTPRGDVLLLPKRPPDDPEDLPEGIPVPTEGVWVSAPVRLPCDAPSVVLQIKADGYRTWTSDPLRLPEEGGEETLEIPLVGDYGTGKMKVALEDDAGEKVNYAGAGVQLEIARLDPGAGAAAYVLEQREDLLITDLPAGRYRMRFLSAAFAPLQVEATVYAGQTAEQVLRVRPPAKLKVAFFAPEPTLVRFRLTQAGKVVHGIPEGATSRGTDEKTGEPILTAGADGLLLSGLGAGTYQVEVISDEVAAPPTTVHLKEGDTVETEIAVSMR